MAAQDSTLPRGDAAANPMAQNEGACYVPTREESFLLALIADRPNLSGGESLDDAAEHLDWQTVIRLASATLMPYLDLCTRTRLRPESVPENVKSSLSLARKANAARHLQRRNGLKVILAALQQGGIPAVVLKGMVLAHETYTDQSLRPMVDIDLLISSGKYEQATTVLGKAGYKIPERYRYRHQVGHDGIPQMEKPLQRPGSKIMVELHTSLEFGEAQGKVDLTAIQSRTREVDLDGISARTLGHAEFLIHLCHHLSSHHLFDKGLLPLLDVHLFVRKHQADLEWPGLAGTALHHGGAEWVYLTLMLARDLLGTPVPDLFFSKVPPPRRLPEVAALATRQILRSGEAAILPGLLELAKQPGARKALWIGRRLMPGRGIDPGGSALGGGLVRAALVASHRLMIDLKTRARMYGSSWRRGDLTRENVEKSLQLQRGRETIIQIMTGRSAKAAAVASSSSRR